MKFRLFLILAAALSVSACSGNPGKGESSEAAPQKYCNPIVPFDYSDPDVIRVGNDYWMTASSFGCIPGLPILHSDNLIDWEIVNYALDGFYSGTDETVLHGNAVWAPCIRYHDGMFYIYWGDPDYGIYMVRTADPLGEWEKPVLVKEGKGMIDPSPLWDDDGRAYLSYAWAASRSGMNSVVTLIEMNPEGTKQISKEPLLVYDGIPAGNNTTEGTKLYKRNGWYYIFAPAGGVATGWQVVARSRSIYGPYEARTVMAQGTADINGPHQGAWIDTPSGEHWFIHFQEIQPAGRVLHLQPMAWTDDDWCVIGEDPDADGCGQPVRVWNRPGTVPQTASATQDTQDIFTQMSDEFDSPEISLAWQWHGEKQDLFGLGTNEGYYRMYAWNNEFTSLWEVPNLLLQKIPCDYYRLDGEELTPVTGWKADTKFRFYTKNPGDAAGLVVMGYDYARASLKSLGADKAVIELVTCKDAHKGGEEEAKALAEIPLKLIPGGAAPTSYADIWLRLEERGQGLFIFSYSLDGENFTPMNADAPFQAREGRWIGAKAGFFCVNEEAARNKGWIDIDYFRAEML